MTPGDYGHQTMRFRCRRSRNESVDSVASLPALEGAQPCILDARYPMPATHSPPQPHSRERNRAPSTADTSPYTPHPRHNRPPRRTTMHPRRQIPYADVTFPGTTALQGAHACTLDPSYPTPAPHSAAQSPPRAHMLAPSTADTSPNTPHPRHNRPRGRTCLHPRPQLPHAGATIRHVSALQGAQTCTLEGTLLATLYCHKSHLFIDAHRKERRRVPRNQVTQY